MWTALGVVFAIVAGTVSITLVVTDRQISGLERSLQQLERSQAQQAESILAIISGLERSQAQQAESTLALVGAQNESVLIQLRLLNDKMTSIESEHAELRSLYEKVGVLQAEVEYIRRDLDVVRANQDTMRADLDVVRANQEKILKTLETLDGN